MFADKLRGTSLKSDESIGLLGLREGERSYMVEVKDSEVMNHLRNICST